MLCQARERERTREREANVQTAAPLVNRELPRRHPAPAARLTCTAAHAPHAAGIHTDSASRYSSARPKTCSPSSPLFSVISSIQAQTDEGRDRVCDTLAVGSCSHQRNDRHPDRAGFEFILFISILQDLYLAIFRPPPIDYPITAMLGSGVGLLGRGAARRSSAGWQQCSACSSQR